MWKKRYPDLPEKHGIPFTGIENATPEALALGQPPVGASNLPFGVFEYLDHLDELPLDPNLDPDLGD